jgi:glycosyltransferase involved in cell wall biosynthesis
MLNIISRSIVSKHTRGPRKVVQNLLQGLDALGYPYVVNAALDATDQLWIHDDPVAVRATAALSPAISVIAGPNIYLLPGDIPPELDTSRILWLQPAPWVENFWREFSPHPLQMAVWPVGIDTDTFAPLNTAVQKDLVLVYNKQRSDADVAAVCTALDARGERFTVLTYGSYHEQEYRALLGQSKAVVWVGRSESQGIGLLEALAMDTPILLWDIQKLGDFVGSEQSGFTAEQLAFAPVTAAPYWSEECGARFVSGDELAPTLDHFLATLTTYRPRAYIEETLSLKRQAGAFLELFLTHFTCSEENLRDTTLRSTARWQNDMLSFRLRTRLKDAVRSVIR